MAKFSGFGDDIQKHIERLGLLKGEMPNIVEASLRDITENVSETMRRGWPLGRRKYPSDQRPHSAGLWSSEQRGKVVFVVVNTAEYASYVHNQPKYGGPPGLADRTIPDLVEEVQAAPLEFVSKRVVALLDGGR